MIIRDASKAVDNQCVFVTLFTFNVKEVDAFHIIYGVTDILTV